ncbi:hypothetical protein CcCBS67573_g08811 [Chytriomyces confervae]|uniref:G-protein coupled receptors family 1 profile domain-containing protein n=1 Tax=Chytriomyces confervae TaxID=246404 RepID=A0A507EHR7_9FUNG|nr:hypothetical protein CcCBS67573_g08811 [Chytriomyces confervae]
MPLDTLNLFFSAIFAIFGFIGTATNLLVVIPNAGYLTRIAPSSFLVFWLCFFDSIALTNSALVAASNLATGELNYDAASCRFHAGVSVFGNVSSILLCFGLTLFRYLIVVHQKDIPKNFVRFYVLGVVFSSAFVSSLPFMMGSQEQIYKMRPCNAHCSSDWSQHDARSSVLIWMCFSIATITLCFVVYAYAAMAGTILEVFATVKDVGGGRVASKRVKIGNDRNETDDKKDRMSSAERASNSVVTEGGVSSQNNQSRDFQSARKLEKRQHGIMKQSIVVVGAFMIGWAPYICS